MTPPDEDESRSDILDNYRAQLQAMVEGDTEALQQLLADEFTLTHMTGYVQPKSEWLEQMRAGQFIYRTAEERDTSLRVDGDRAHFVGRIVTDATVYGARAHWRLQLTMDFTRTHGRWVASHSRATTW